MANEPNTEQVEQGEAGSTQLPLETEAGAVERLEAEMEQLRSEMAEMNDRYLRTMADFDNFRRRFRQDKDDAIRYGVGSLLLDMLPVLDNLHRALAAAERSPDPAALTQGVELTRSQFEQVLERRGVAPIVALGVEFDPNLHEAVGRMPMAGKPEGTIVEEIERGYTLDGKVLRPSKVLVAMAPVEAREQTQQ